MSTLAEIEKLTSKYADARTSLSTRVTAFQRALDQVRKEHMPRLKEAVGRCAERHAELKTEVETNPDLFKSPKTMVFSGIRVGFKKGAGSLDWEDDARVVTLIKKHFPDQAEVLIKTKETPSKEGLENLDAGDLKRLGVTVTGTGDMVYIKPTDGAVDKAVKAMLKDAEEEADEQRAAA